MQHALVLGDISMIHDPLASRRRALIFGAIAVVLIALGSGLLAWLRPDPNPGDAQLLRSEQSQLYVRVEETLHPVANLASARLILGEAAEPASIGSSALEDAALGTPIGIADAPVELAA
ncbi:type VII secretion protein EccB, partial [Corynebacterium casei]|uniref:type VII secretion protein EccB n=1 Tax=Corynebacterium casei TaxID=160386 RepID=UPI003F93BD9B